MARVRRKMMILEMKVKGSIFDYLNKWVHEHIGSTYYDPMDELRFVGVLESITTAGTRLRAISHLSPVGGFAKWKLTESE
jgi:hypothetical protein